MDEELEKNGDDRGYTPRPAWQVWMARIGLVVFVAWVIWETVRMAQGWY